MVSFILFLILSHNFLFAESGFDGKKEISATRFIQEERALKNSLNRQINPKDIFEDSKDKAIFFARILEEHRLSQRPDFLNYVKNGVINGVILEQRSDRKRLYDHNIFLRGLFQGRFIHKSLGSLKDLFKSALFVDLGSAILAKEGAPTVRDIYEDEKVRPYLSKILATDINDYSSAGTQYINIFTKSGLKLPFPLEEIDMSITRFEQVSMLIKPYVTHENTALIFRSANSGPDLYYNMDQIKYHLRAVIVSAYERNLLYLFNNLVLFKQARTAKFQLLGTMDKDMGFAHMHRPWNKINWQERKLEAAFQPNGKYLAIKPD